MAALTAVSQVPMYEGQRSGAVTYTQPAVAEGPVNIDFGFVPTMAIITADVAASGWIWHRGMAAGTCAALYGAVDVPANGVTLLNGDPATSTILATPGGAGNLHVIKEGVDFDMDAADAVNIVVRGGIRLGTAIQGTANNTVHVFAWH